MSPTTGTDVRPEKHVQNCDDKKGKSCRDTVNKSDLKGRVDTVKNQGEKLSKNLLPQPSEDKTCYGNSELSC
jgi:hypothetical protein